MNRLFILFLLGSLNSPLMSQQQDLPLFMEGTWVGYPADSSFKSELRYTLSKHERFLYAENQLFTSEGRLFRTYEGMYFIQNDTLKYFLKGPGDENHAGLAFTDQSTLTHVARVYPGGSVRSYRSQIIMNSKDQFSYYASYSKLPAPPDTLELTNPIIYIRSTDQ